MLGRLGSLGCGQWRRCKRQPVRLGGVSARIMHGAQDVHERLSRSTLSRLRDLFGSSSRRVLRAARAFLRRKSRSQEHCAPRERRLPPKKRTPQARVADDEKMRFKWTLSPTKYVPLMALHTKSRIHSSQTFPRQVCDHNPCAQLVHCEAGCFDRGDTHLPRPCWFAHATHLP